MPEAFKSQSRERRASARSSFETEATVHMVNQEFKCQTRNLSNDGLALAGHEASVPAGTFMRVQFRLPKEKQPIDVDGILVRSDPRNTGMVWGLRFIEPPDGAQSKIESYLDTRVPETPRFPSREPAVEPEEHRESAPDSDAAADEVPDPTAPEPQQATEIADDSEGFLGELEEEERPVLAAEPAPDEHAPTTEPLDLATEDAGEEIDVPLIPRPVLAPEPSRSPSRQTPAPDTQFIHLYEEALSKASHQRLIDQYKRDHPPERVEEPNSNRPAKAFQSGRATDLDRELQWLYDQATAEADGGSARNAKKPKTKQRSKSTRARAS